jgi:hypothetical protein
MRKPATVFVGWAAVWGKGKPLASSLPGEHFASVHKGKKDAQPSSNDTVNTMKLSKFALLLTLAILGAPAFAGDNTSTAATTKAPVETYTYDTHLDIKRVISVSDVGDECGAVPAQMTYEDSHGQQHVLEYQVMGTGCSNG